MSSPSDSRSRIILAELDQADRTLTISDITDLVIPRLLSIPEDVSKHFNCSQILLRRLKKFRMDLEHIKDHFDRLKVLEQHADKDHFSWLKVLDRHADKDIKDLLRQVVDTPITVFTDDSRYWQLVEILTRLKIRMPSTTYGSLLPGLTDPKGHEPEDHPGKLASEPLGMNPFIENPAAFKQFTESYELLDPLLKKCLLCFSAFPECAEINKRTVIYWWIGEQLIKPPAGDDGEKNGHEILKILVEHGFLENVTTKGRLTSRCRVRPFIRSVLIYLAKAASFFDYLDDRENNDDHLIHGNKRRVCLVKAEKYLPTSSSSLVHLRRSRATDLECIKTLFNVNKCYLDIKLHWFWKMKNMKALYLGRCDSKAIQHIEVKSCKFLAGLMYMKGLRLLSFQGVSKIVKLPDSVGYCKNLRILDLRDCNDMEELPEAVKSVEKLTHLDLSGCYSLSCLPKGISFLLELQVLKGFLVREKLQDKRDLCAFQDLKKLKNLRKLSITTSLRTFPENEHLEALSEMAELRKLTIAWRGLYREETAEKTGPHLPDNFSLEGLKKLDLQHIPCKRAPAWLAPDKLQNLKKLYIKGGKFLQNLGEKQISGWEVETLRLLHLPKLSMAWILLQTLFPNLRYLELVKCPTLTSVPCNNEGVWEKGS